MYAYYFIYRGGAICDETQLQFSNFEWELARYDGHYSAVNTFRTADVFAPRDSANGAYSHECYSAVNTFRTADVFAPRDSANGAYTHECCTGKCNVLPSRLWRYTARSGDHGEYAVTSLHVSYMTVSVEQLYACMFKFYTCSPLRRRKLPSMSTYQTTF